MKKRYLLLAVLALLAVACNKEHQCKCNFEGDNNRMQFLTVDRGLKCDDITEMAIERHVIDSVTGTPTLERVEMHKVSCHEYAEE
ncbi:MAG: hypothetical protein IKP21_00745 [Bacteroidales bacterium]|nr:hypothetical protein [Bacteroidales bacterium]